MSDNVTIHNGHCSYHGPAEQAPVWAARAAALAPAKWHDLKIHPQPLSDLLSGAKTGELRRDDRGYQVGDGVHLTCPDGREARYLISHIQRGYGLPDDLVVLSYRAPAPAPMTSFEDTTHAWEEGYRAGCAAVKVKPLEWRQYGDAGSVAFSDVTGRQYAIFPSVGREGEFAMRGSEDRGFTYHLSIEAAQTAAQEHHAARILAALEGGV